MAVVIHWFRRDFRVRDNTALLQAARAAGAGGTVVGMFVINPGWMEAGARQMGAHQARFWLESLQELSRALARRGIPLLIRRGDPAVKLLAAARMLGAERITYNKEYEPAQRAADERLAREATVMGIRVEGFKDAVLFEEGEVATEAGRAYRVFTAYWKQVQGRLQDRGVRVGGLVPRMRPPCVRSDAVPMPEDLGFASVDIEVPAGERSGARMLGRFCREAMAAYAERRNVPARGLEDAQGSTSRLSAHLSAGTVSIRQAAAAALAAGALGPGTAAASAKAWLSELAWRDFYRMILFHFPHTVSRAFEPRYKRLRWGNDPARIAAFAEGRTGYPLVDAALAQLRATGFMHNRLRMVTAMFLTKHLDVSWVVGERFFMRTLMDYDQAANVGGWQWSASTGTDAAPYFRVMNPVKQSERWDPDGRFIRHYVPALRSVAPRWIHAPWQMPAAEQERCGCVIGRDYPGPIVDHATARRAALERYRAARG